jgi:tetratricopeptide (TPR) repeat protein
MRDLRQNILLYAGMFAVAVSYLAARYHALGSFTPVERGMSKSEFMLSAVTVAAQYFGKLAAPTNLNYFHVFEPTRSIQPAFILSLTVILALTVAFLVLRQRASSQPGISRMALVAFGLWWIALTLAPALDLARVGENAFAERYLYLPSVGFVWIAAIAGEWLSKRMPTLAYTAGVLVLVIFAWTTIVRNEDWHDDLRLMQVTARQSPESASIHDNLANDYAEVGKLDEALAEEKIASQLAPETWRYHLNLGNLLISRDPRAAVEECEQVVKSIPREADANYCIGAAWKTAGDSKQAVIAYERTLAIAPDYYSAMLALHRLYWESGRVADAINLLQRAARVRPSEPEPLIRLAVLYSDGGRYPEAAQAAQQGLALSPDPHLAYFAHYVLGTVYRRAGSLDAAITEFRKAYQADPDRREARGEYERLLAQLNAK